MRLLSAFVLALCLLASSAHAEPPKDDNRSAQVQVSDESPRAMLQRFFTATRKGDYTRAAEFLDVPPSRTAEAGRLARRLKIVLDRKLWVDVEGASPAATGNFDDGLPPHIEEVGRLPGPTGAQEPLRLISTVVDGRTSWRFTRSTVQRIDAWYEALPDRLVIDHMPDRLLRMGPFELMWWQWIALPLSAVLCWLLGRLFGWLTRRILSRFASRTTVTWDDLLVARARGPLTLFWSIACGYAVLPYLALALPAEKVTHAALKSGLVAAIFWSALRSIDLASDVLTSTELPPTPGTRAVLPIAARFGKVAVGAMLIIAVLSNFGLPVASLIAGLGVGGVALALAAQKTVENMFGAVSIGADRPLKIGDFVKVGELLGTVESIGLRSTRIRTLDRTLVTIPNGGLADSRIESYTERDRIRFTTILGLEYGTKQAVLREVIAKIERTLREHPKIWPDTVVVRFAEFGPYSLNIEIMVWFLVTDFNDFRAIREGVLFDIMTIVEQEGAAFAFPTQTLHLLRAN